MKIPWRREWLPTPVFLPEELYGQRSLASYSPWSCKELDTTEQLTNIWLRMFQAHSKVRGCSLEIHLVSGLRVSRSVISDSWEPHGLQPARLLHPWDSQGRNTRGVTIPFSRGSSQPKEWTWVFCIAGRFFVVWVTREFVFFKKFQDSSDMHLPNSYCLSRARWLSVPLNEDWKPYSETPSSVNSWSFHIEQIKPYSIRPLIYMSVSTTAPIILLTCHLFPVILWACCCCYLATKSCLTLRPFGL